MVLPAITRVRVWICCPCVRLKNWGEAPTATIVGLLDVGASQDNFQELSKWITKQLASSASEGAANELPQLESQFRVAVSHYPEF